MKQGKMAFSVAAGMRKTACKLSFLLLAYSELEFTSSAARIVRTPELIRWSLRRPWIRSWRLR
jgi:hypothetical protein